MASIIKIVTIGIYAINIIMIIIYGGHALKNIVQASPSRWWDYLAISLSIVSISILSTLAITTYLLPL